MFHTAREDDIKAGRITDVYFLRTLEILDRERIDAVAEAEVTLKAFPESWAWGILAGIEEVMGLLTGLPVDVDAFREGSSFRVGEPILTVRGPYRQWGHYETAILGLLCQASGIATKAARCKRAAEGRTVISFGARRMHPVLAPMIERNAFIGGCDGVAVVKSAELIKEEPVGTMPHALILILGDTVKAAKAFDATIDPRVKRVVLIDTLGDEKFEALRVAEALGERLFAVRLDTPASRRGDMLEILKEVRWELNSRGFSWVKLFVSGGLNEAEIQRLNPLADAYGVGTAISNAPVMNFALDLIEIDGRPIAKRGKRSGRKAVYHCRGCRRRWVLPADASPPACPCGESVESLLIPLLRQGRTIQEMPRTQQIRSRVLEELEHLAL
ncbi:MAG: nicotinate phosphoribosyltransferase [candidate division NC10 bacterium]|nr:nicotinate phosphoribosyltransferase [candidate division NC10 bacterium]